MCIVALAFLAIASLGVAIPGAAFAKAIADRLVCAVGLEDDCGGGPSGLLLAYGSELADLVTDNAPELDYEEGMHAVPVDFRSCREDACANGADSGPVRESLTGEPVTLFTHVIDCRDSGNVSEGLDCSGGRAGNVYLQYWAYYPGSRTSKDLYGLIGEGFHPDDWESWQVRISPGETQSRASSHTGYNGTSGSPINDTGKLWHNSAWTDETGRYEISGGSHAGRVGTTGPLEKKLGRRFAGPHRWTPGSQVNLVPIESLRDVWGDYEFPAITPPWFKRVFRDPEWNET